MTVRLGLLGHKGRMGQAVAQLLSSDFTGKAALHATADRGDAFDAMLGSDCVIDFSAPEAMLSLARSALAGSIDNLPVFVVGSTGWKLEERRVLEELAAKTHVLASSNFSLGVLALLSVLRRASPVLEKLGYTPVIVETHHKHKKDSPSGTALSLQRAISPAGPGNVQTHSVRAGEIIGDHDVTWYGIGDTLSFRHHAQDRSIFARGAIQTALWLASKRGAPAPGKLLGMDSYFDELTQGI